MVQSPIIFDIYNYGIQKSLVNSYLSQLVPTFDQLVLRKF